ncbi:MAG: amidohydrolase family protein [Salinibacter sp.]
MLSCLLSRALPVALLLLLPASAAAQSSPGSTHRLLLTNARLVDPESKRIHRGALRIEGERIDAVLDDAPARFDGRTLDLDGKWVLPGLVDAHVHSWGNAGPTFQERQLLQTDGTARTMLYAGVTAFLDLFSPEDYIFDLRNKQRRDGLRAADIYAAGPILTCPDGHGTEYGTPTRTVPSPTDARQTVDSLAARRPDVVKLVYHPYRTERFPSMDRPTMAAIVDAARAHGLLTVVHIKSWEGAHEAIVAGVDVITHTPPAPLPDSTLSAMQAHGTAWIPTLAVHTELSHLLEHPERLQNDLLRAVADSSLRAAYRDTTGLPPQIQSWMDRQSQHRSTRLQAVKKGADAGIPLLAGTDAGNPGLIQGYSLHRELQLLADAGLSNWDVLSAATTQPGRLLDAPFGLRPGARANLLVLKDSPRADIHHTQDIHRVIYRGRVVDRSAIRNEDPSAVPDVPAP